MAKVAALRFVFCFLAVGKFHPASINTNHRAKKDNSSTHHSLLPTSDESMERLRDYQFRLLRSSLSSRRRQAQNMLYLQRRTYHLRQQRICATHNRWTSRDPRDDHFTIQQY